MCWIYSKLTCSQLVLGWRSKNILASQQVVITYTVNVKTLSWHFWRTAANPSTSGNLQGGEIPLVTVSTEEKVKRPEKEEFGGTPCPTCYCPLLGLVWTAPERKQICGMSGQAVTCKPVCCTAHASALRDWEWESNQNKKHCKRTQKKGEIKRIT